MARGNCRSRTEDEEVWREEETGQKVGGEESVQRNNKIDSYPEAGDLSLRVNEPERDSKC